ncbi:MAG: alkaline phosphatase D family protein [Gemmatimonadetes bacterium]|nr:alkaline phosphatase D family protein [Gemmatimonadota bacterium]
MARSRRAFLADWLRASALCAIAPLPLDRFGVAACVAGEDVRPARNPSFSSSPFELGVASGEPGPDGAVLWTRLMGVSDPTSAVPVRWEVSADEGFRRIARTGEAMAHPDLAHSVHVELDGLEAGRHYWYRFHAGDATSPVGRTRTAPAPGSEPGRFDFVFTSCQHYERGWYTGYRHMARETCDLVVHLGDYIYEEGPGLRTDLVRRHDTPEVRTLEAYRARYALYKRDLDLQAAHAAFPWVFTPDDHEVDNDWAGEHNHEGMTPSVFLARRTAAFQAMYEHLPLRSGAIPTGPDAQLFRRLDFGAAMRLHVLDTRQYRTIQPCGGRRAVPCDERFADGATILGEAQATWLRDGLDASPARYNVIANQVFMARLLEGEGELTLAMDKWDGYPEDRQRLMAFLDERRPSNPVVITGDLHTSWVNDLKRDFERPDSATVGTELAGTSISSSGDGVDVSPQGVNAMSLNPHVKFFNAQRGYVRCSLGTDRLRADYRVMPFVTRPDAPIATRASFVVEDGVPGATEA